jgi:hypothetical protein
MDWRGFGSVHHSRTTFCRAVPNPNLTIRNFFFSVRCRRCRRVRPRTAPPHPATATTHDFPHPRPSRHHHHHHHHHPRRRRRRPAPPRPPPAAPPRYCDDKVANREIRVWRFVTENGIESWTHPKPLGTNLDSGTIPTGLKGFWLRPSFKDPILSRRAQP